MPDKTKSLFPYAILLFVVLVILRIPVFFQPVLDVDEAIYALFARIWFDGGIPYVDCVETKPLGIYFFYGLIFSVFGKYNMAAVHAVTIIIVGLTAYIIHLIAARLYSKQAGLWAALLYIVFSTTYIPKIIATMIETIMLLFVALQYYYWIRFEYEDKKGLAFASGLAFSIACLFKYQAGMNLFIFLIYLGIIKPFFIRGGSYKAHWRGFLTFLIGAVIPPVIMLIYLKDIGALNGFLFWNIKGNASYISEGSLSISVFHQVVTRVLPYIASTALIWVLLAFQIKKIRRAQDWLILVWFILSIIPVSTGYRFYGHYFLLLLPPMSILSSAVIERVWINKKRLAQVLVIFWIILPAIGFTTARFFISDINKAVGEDNLADYKPLAKYVKDHTEPADRIVAWGYAPLIYWYSERLPATRFFWSDVLTGRVPGRNADTPYDENEFVMTETWDMFFADLSRHNPVYIIDTTPADLHDYKNFPISRYPKLLEYIQNHYKKEAVLNNAVFYRRID